MHTTNQIFFVTNLCVSLYAMCFWIQLGTLPYLAKKLEVNPVTFGYLQTVFAVVQLLGGPVFGRFGDLFGSRKALMIAFISAFASYFLLGISNTLFVLFLSRLPSIFMHAMQGAQMVVTDQTDDNQRSNSLGKLALSYGIGMVCGPIIGGLCTQYGSEHFSAFVAAFGSLISLLIVYLFIPSSTKNLNLPEKENKLKKKKLFDLKLTISLVWNNHTTRHWMLVKVISGLPVGIFHSMFSLIMIEHFLLPADVNGYILSYVGVVSMITQGFIIGFLTKKGVSEQVMITLSIGILSGSYLMMSIFSRNFYAFCVVLMPMAIAGSLFTTVIQSIMTKNVSKENTGSMLGLSMAANSMIRSISPTIGGYMFNRFGFASFGWLGFIFNGFLFIYLQYF